MTGEVDGGGLQRLATGSSPSSGSAGRRPFFAPPVLVFPLPVGDYRRSMAETITVLHTPGCPNVTVAIQRLSEAIGRLPGPAPRVTVEEIADADEARRRKFSGSPTVLIDGVDPFAGPESSPAFACRRYLTESGVEGAPSVDQIVAALAG